MKRSAAMLFLALVVSLSACTASTSTGNVSQSKSSGAAKVSLTSLPKNADLLFAVQAEAGELKPADSGSFSYTLVLRKTASQTTWFTDRPERKGGTISTDALVTDWENLGFVRVPPNAALTHSELGSAAPLVVELGKPAYDQTGQTLRIPVQVIGQNTSEGIEGSFGAASLFIDNATTSDGCGYTGEIDYFPESITPAGYVPADGRGVPKSEYPELYAVTGDRFGTDGDRFLMPTVPGPGKNLHAVVCALGGVDPAETDPSEQASYGCLVGRVQLFAQETPVYGYALAHGQQLPITKHSWLFSYSGNRFGGDGVTSFALPNIASPAGTSQQVCTSNAHPWSRGIAAGNAYISEVSYWATDMRPSNWAPTIGTPLPIAQWRELYSLLHATFGGDGTANFALPTVDLPDPNLSGGIAIQGPYPPSQ